jgi:hypothetical protein
MMIAEVSQHRQHLRDRTQAGDNQIIVFSPGFISYGGNRRFNTWVRAAPRHADSVAWGAGKLLPVTAEGLDAGVNPQSQRRISA